MCESSPQYYTEVKIDTSQMPLKFTLVYISRDTKLHILTERAFPERALKRAFRLANSNIMLNNRATKLHTDAKIASCYRKDSQISCTFFPKICDQNRRCGLSARSFGKGLPSSSLPSSDIIPGYTALHSACKKTTNLRAKFYGKTALNGEIPVSKYQNNINHMS